MNAAILNRILTTYGEGDEPVRARVLLSSRATLEGNAEWHAQWECVVVEDVRDDHITRSTTYIEPRFIAALQIVHYTDEEDA